MADKMTREQASEWLAREAEGAAASRGHASRGPTTATHRFKPFHVEARQFTPETAAELSAWTDGEVYQRYAFGKPDTLVLEIKVNVIADDENGLEATEGDWVLKREQDGKFIVLPDGLFVESYEPLSKVRA